MKTKVAVLIVLVGLLAVWGQYQSGAISGGGGGGVALSADNPSGFVAGLSTTQNVDVTDLNLSDLDPALLQCKTAAAPVTITSFSTTGVAPITSITFNYASTADVRCSVNATGGAGVAGPQGPPGDLSDIFCTLGLDCSKAGGAGNFSLDQEYVRDMDACVSAAGTDTYACTPDAAPTAYTAGQQFKFQADVANTGVATLNLNSLGAVTIKKAEGGVTTDLEDGDIPINLWVSVIYDGTNFQCLNCLGNASASGKAITATNGGAYPIHGWSGALMDLGSSVALRVYISKFTTDEPMDISRISYRIWSTTATGATANVALANFNATQILAQGAVAQDGDTAGYKTADFSLLTLEPGTYSLLWTASDALVRFSGITVSTTVRSHTNAGAYSRNGHCTNTAVSTTSFPVTCGTIIETDAIGGLPFFVLETQ